MDGYGKLERMKSQGKVWEFENKRLWQTALENSFILFKRGKNVHSHEIVEAHLPPHWGLPW